MSSEKNSPGNNRSTAANGNGREVIRPFEQNGNFTMINNYLITELIPELSEAELRVFLFLLRKIIGYHKEEDAIAYTQIARGTGIGSRSTIVKGLKGLIERGVIIKLPGPNQHCSTVYRINKYFEMVINQEEEPASSTPTVLLPIDIADMTSTPTVLLPISENGSSTSSGLVSSTPSVPLMAGSSTSSGPEAVHEVYQQKIDLKIKESKDIIKDTLFVADATESAPPIEEEENLSLSEEEETANNGRHITLSVSSHLPGFDPDPIDKTSSTRDQKKKRTKERTDQLEAKGRTSQLNQQEAVKLFRDITDYNALRSWQLEQIVENVTDLSLWREVLQGWIGRGYKKENLLGMLGVYQHSGNFDYQAEKKRKEKEKEVQDYEQSARSTSPMGTGQRSGGRRDFNGYSSGDGFQKREGLSGRKSPAAPAPATPPTPPPALSNSDAFEQFYRERRNIEVRAWKRARTDWNSSGRAGAEPELTAEQHARKEAAKLWQESRRANDPGDQPAGNLYPRAISQAG
jgi:phage replication O-like protein O